MIPVVFIVPAVATGVVGAGKTVKSVVDNHRANCLTDDANSNVDGAKQYLERSRKLCSTELSNLGAGKLFVLNNSIARFIDSFERIKNLDLVDSEGLDELKKYKVDKESIAELKEMQQFAAASTGTAIASLSGAAATNATLAFFGGGSIAAGGLGMAGGTMVLGGLVAGPALLAMGLITGKKADEKLEVAKANIAQAEEISEELRTAAFQCDAIRRRTAMFYSFLARIDARFAPLVFQLSDVLGDDYSSYSAEAKSVVLRSATMAGSVKAILDTPILTDEGALTEESSALMESLGVKLAEEV